MRERFFAALATGILATGGCTTEPNVPEAGKVHASASASAAEGFVPEITDSLEGITVYEDAFPSPTDPTVVAFQANDKAHEEPVIVIQRNGIPSTVIRNAYYPRWQTDPGSGLQADLAFTTGLMPGGTPSLAIFNPYRNEVAASMPFIRPWPTDVSTAGWEGAEFVQHVGSQRRAISDPKPTPIPTRTR